MPKYEFTISLEPRPAEGGGERNIVDPTLADMAEAIEVGLAAKYGDDYEVNAYNGSRPDQD